MRFSKDDGWRQLDTLRLLLALTVAVSHAVGIFAHPFNVISEPTNELFSCASEIAVELFFLTSGLVIGRSLHTKSVYANKMFLIFMERRFGRIYPPLIFSVLLTMLLAWILRLLDLDHYVGNAANLTRDSFSYLDNLKDIEEALLTFGFRGGLTGSSNGPLWSLTLEMQAYVMIGLLAQAIFSTKLWIKIACALGVLFAFRARGINIPNELSLICIGFFATGILLNFLKPKFPEILPIVSIDFSYSLYILHFPIMLFTFFLTCQGQYPTTLKIYSLIFISLAASILVSIFSGLFIERYRLRRFKILTST